MEIRTALIRGWMLFLVASLTLGLAPFSPEPHIVEKIRWIFNGEFPLEGVYIFDTFLHGAPWLLFIISSILRLSSRKKAPSQAAS